MTFRAFLLVLSLLGLFSCRRSNAEFTHQLVLSKDASLVVEVLHHVEEIRVFCIRDVRQPLGDCPADVVERLAAGVKTAAGAAGAADLVGQDLRVGACSPDRNF